MKKMEEIKKTIKEVFYFIDDDIRVSFFEKEENVLLIDVKMKDPQMLIGEKGQTLIETERLLKIIVRKKTNNLLFLNLDINDYKKRKADYLKDLAHSVADEVSRTGIGKKFPPMSAYERRIIHTTLVQREDVITESMGSDLERRVLVRKK